MISSEKPGIYKISDDQGRCYIGSSVLPSRRWRQHLYDLRRNRHHSPRLQNLFNKYGETAITFSMVLNVHPLELERAEQDEIDRVRPCLNALKQVGPKRMHNDPYYRVRLVQGLKEANKRPEYRQARIDGQARVVRAVACSNGMTFSSCSEAARFFNVSSGSVSACCSGKTHKLSCGVSVWYADGTTPPRNLKMRRTRVLCVEAGQEFESVWKAALFAKVTRPAINYAVKNGTYSGGYRWRLV